MLRSSFGSRCRQRLLPVTVAPVVTFALASACVVYRPLEVRPVRDAITVESPTKAHLYDGSVVVFATGVRQVDDSLRGVGVRYDLNSDYVADVAAVPLDSVLGVEAYFGGDVNTPATVLLTSAATGAAAVGAAVLSVAIFGSCPTVYTDDAPGDGLEAELFSHSIAPLLEARDVDVLAAKARGGLLSLEIRNEALETHYINHLELLEVAHRPDEWIVPDGRGIPWALGSVAAPASVRDRIGRDLGATLVATDDEAYATAPDVVENASSADYLDYVDVTFPAPAGRDTVALALRLRNSLLNTILFYDFMLAPGGLTTAEWLTDSMQQIGQAVHMGHWYQQYFGLHVAVWSDGEWVPVDRLPDVGPIAWKDITTRVPVPSDADTVRVRLSFLADQWRIDRLAVADEVRLPETRVLPAARAFDRRGEALPGVLTETAAPDRSYLETRPGSVFTLEFDVGEDTGPVERSWLLASQGYYTEWLRQDWLKQAALGGPADPFTPTDATLDALFERWRSVGPEMERRFFASRIPTGGLQ